MKDLTVSAIDRQNILNNKKALQNIQEYIGISGMLFENEYKFTKYQIAEFYVIDSSTIDRYLSSHEEELKHNGYVNLKVEYSVNVSISNIPTSLSITVIEIPENFITEVELRSSRKLARFPHSINNQNLRNKFIGFRKFSSIKNSVGYHSSGI